MNRLGAINLISIITIQLLTLPTFLATLIYWIHSRLQLRKSITNNEAKKRVLVTGDIGTKALHIIRALGKAGHEIIYADWAGQWCALRWSKYVKKCIDIPKLGNDPSQYIQGVIDVVNKENIDWYIPVSHMHYSVSDSIIKDHLAEHNPRVKCLTNSKDVIDLLDDKLMFLSKCKEVGVTFTDFATINNESDIYELAKTGMFDRDHYFCKPLLPYSKNRLNFTRIPSSEEGITELLKQYEGEPIFINKFVTGSELIANAIVSNGEVLLFQACDGSPIQRSYEVINKPKLQEWVVKFCKAINHTGCICFDFIEAADGEMYCIECNPRLHSSIVSYYESPDVEKVINEALTMDVVSSNNNEKPIKNPLLPPANNKNVYWLYEEIRRTLIGEVSIKNTFSAIKNGKEAIWDIEDPLPFFIYHHIHIPYQYLKMIIQLQEVKIINYCLGRVY